MAHDKCYAICENKCQVETMSRNEISVLINDLSRRVTTLSGNLSAIIKKANQSESDITAVKSDLYNLRIEVNKMDSVLTSLNNWAMEFVSVEFPDFVLYVRNLEKRIEVLENA